MCSPSTSEHLQRAPPLNRGLNALTETELSEGAYPDPEPEHISLHLLLMTCTLNPHPHPHPRSPQGHHLGPLVQSLEEETEHSRRQEKGSGVPGLCLAACLFKDAGTGEEEGWRRRKRNPAHHTPRPRVCV